MKKFYIISSIINLGVLYFLGQVLFPLLEHTANDYVSHYVETSIFVHYGHNFYTLVFWWLAPLYILWIKNYHLHLFVFYL